MSSAVALSAQGQKFRVVLPAAVLGCLLFAALLQDWFALEIRQAASGLGLIVAGVFLAVSCRQRARLTRGRRRRSWLLIMTGAMVAIAGNVWAVAIGSDPVTSPSVVSDVSIMIALALCSLALFSFPSVRRRGIDRVVIVLDGLIIGGSVLIIASTLVYADLLDEAQDTASAQFTTLLIPVLDVLLVVAALVLLLRARGSDRLSLALLALGFLAYGITDLAFVLQVAGGDFGFGTTLDLGWIVGYALLALAAWCPSDEVDVPEGPATASEVPDTVLVFVLLTLAAAVQVQFGDNGDLRAFLSVSLCVFDLPVPP